MRSLSNPIRQPSLGCALVALALVALPGLSANSQQPEPVGNRIPGNPASTPLLQPLAAKPAEPLDIESQKQLVNAIYQDTKTVATARELTAFIEKCDGAISRELSSSNHNYVVSLKGWALNRRAELRLDVARQMQEIDNQAAYRQIFDEAISDFNSAVATDPNRHRSWNTRGTAHLVNGDYLAAVEDFSRATELKADYTVAWFNRAEALFHAGKYQAAIDDYSIVLRLAPDDLQARTGRGHAYLGAEDYANAMADYEAVLQQQPGNGIARLNRGDAFLKWGKWKEALEDFEAASKSGASLIADQRTAWLKATCPVAEFRDAQQALELIERCQAAGLRTTAALETLAAAQAGTGAFMEARQSQKQAIQLAGALEEPDHPSHVRLALYESEQPYSSPAPSVDKAPESPETGKQE